MKVWTVTESRTAAATTMFTLGCFREGERDKRSVWVYFCPPCALMHVWHALKRDHSQSWNKTVRRARGEGETLSAINPDHGSEDWKGPKHFPARDQLGEVPLGDSRAGSSREPLPWGLEHCIGDGNKSAGPSVWKLPGQETFSSGAVLFGSLWSRAEFLGVKVQHLCQQPQLPVQVRTLTTSCLNSFTWKRSRQGQM